MSTSCHYCRIGLRKKLGGSSDNLANGSFIVVFVLLSFAEPAEYISTVVVSYAHDFVCGKHVFMCVNLTIEVAMPMLWLIIA